MNAVQNIKALILSREFALKHEKDENIKAFIEGQLSGLQAALKQVNNN